MQARLRGGFWCKRLMYSVLWDDFGKGTLF